MNTPRDLLIITLEVASDRPPGKGDLSLALAGAELVDLLDARAARLRDEYIVPGDNRAVGERLLDEASASLARQEPFETIEDWLWRRGRGLADSYVTALGSEGLITQQRRFRRLPFVTGRTVPADTPARRSALERWTSDEPVLATLGEAVGIRDERPEGAPEVADEAVATVLDAVHDALRDLEAERQKRSIEQAAFDNVWRGP
ncbi:GPP34 family phosphoprotein [Streptomyces sp. NPDC057137]|uniref:GOLPH3/VPS74 family protein n=1 Tax=Streptomyces sp. NPDC057137 TaxID=3346030 RepID=UPI00362A17EB